MIPSKTDLLPLFQAAEAASSTAFVPGTTLAGRLNSWLIAEVAFRQATGCSLFAQPSCPPKEPYQIEFFEDMAIAMRKVRLTEYGQQFLASVAV